MEIPEDRRIRLRARRAAAVLVAALGLAAALRASSARVEHLRWQNPDPAAVREFRI